MTYCCPINSYVIAVELVQMEFIDSSHVFLLLSHFVSALFCLILLSAISLSGKLPHTVYHHLIHCYMS